MSLTMTETIIGTALLHLLFVFIITDDTQQSSTPEKAKPEEKDSSSKWFIWSIREHSSIDRLVLHILYIGPNVAYEVMTKNTSLIKSLGIDLYFLADKLLENKIINQRERKEVTDEHSGRTTDQRMDKLLNILITSISMNEKDFSTFIEILKDEDTSRSVGLAKILTDDYKEKSK